MTKVVCGYERRGAVHAGGSSGSQHHFPQGGVASGVILHLLGEATEDATTSPELVSGGGLSLSAVAEEATTVPHALDGEAEAAYAPTVPLEACRTSISWAGGAYLLDGWMAVWQRPSP